jgi:uncharacterized membrane protein
MSISTRDPVSQVRGGIEGLAGGGTGAMIAMELAKLGVPDVVSAILGGALAAGAALGMSWLRDRAYRQGRGS